MKILIIGGGNMGMTYAQSFLRSHICDRNNLMILEKSAERSYELTRDTEFKVYSEPEDCISVADLIILAVKPQDSHALFERLHSLIDKQQVVLSIMAGVKIKTIAINLGTNKVIRAMPNLPSQIGMGMTVFTSTEDVTRIELVMVQNLINTTGKSLYVSDEALIDAATAISGSGPAYVWYFMKALIEASREMGFSESEAEMLVSQTFKGAVDLFQKTDFSCEEWIKKVASKGGTTEAALSVFERTNLYQDIIAGAKAALLRAEELGKTVDQS